MSAIIGWDFGTGRPVDLPIDGVPNTPLNEIILVRAHHEAIAATTPLSTSLIIWGLHPLLKVCVTFFMRKRDGLGWSDGGYPPSQVTGSIKAYPMTRTRQNKLQKIEGYELPAAQIFANGGSLAFDGCEIQAGMDGIEFVVTASLLGPSDHDVVATIQVKQAMPLGCVELAQKLVDQISIDLPNPPVEWP